MARPRTISDERIMAALAETVGRLGPAKLTLADVARAAGVSTGMLVQRYGSKRDLLLAFSGQTGAFEAGMRKVYDAAPDPVEGLIRALCLADRDLSPAEFANHLAFLHLELADPEFRERLARHAAGVRAEIEHYLAVAVARGLLDVPDIPALASAVDAIRNGSQLIWAMNLFQPEPRDARGHDGPRGEVEKGSPHRRGTLAEIVRGDLETLLNPYRKGV